MQEDQNLNYGKKLFNADYSVLMPVCSNVPILSKQECDFLIGFVKNNQHALEEAKVGDQKFTNKESRNAKIVGIKAFQESNNQIVKQMINSILHKITSAIDDCNEYNFKYDLTDWDDIQVGQYSVGNYYKSHTDIRGYAGAIARKLSFIIQLNDDYSGGKLQFNGNIYRDFEIKDGVGHIIVFPSFVHHEVNEVTDGTRYSLFGWVLGPRLK